MKLIAVVFILFALLMVALSASGIAWLLSFSLWMGGFVSSEVVSWFCRQPEIPLKEIEQSDR